MVTLRYGITGNQRERLHSTRARRQLSSGWTPGWRVRNRYASLRLAPCAD